MDSPGGAGGIFKSQDSFMYIGDRFLTCGCMRGHGAARSQIYLGKHRERFETVGEYVGPIGRIKGQPLLRFAELVVAPFQLALVGSLMSSARTVSSSASGERLESAESSSTNTCLTVSHGQAGSHHGWGWEDLTHAVVRILSQTVGRRVFMLWGQRAGAMKPLINDRHLVLESPHPSPLSAYRGFMGNGHFTAANRFLQATGASPVDW